MGPIIALSGLMPTAKLVNTLARMPPERPKANRRTYERISPKRPVAMLYVSQRPKPKFRNIFLPGVLKKKIANALTPKIIRCSKLYIYYSYIL